MRITSYDPQVSAAVYSQRRAAEESGDSGIATGLARLGRAVSEREERSRRAGAGAMAVREALGFWDDEVRRLDQLGAKVPPGKPGFDDLAMKEHLARRNETIVRLKEIDPAQAEIFDLRTRPLLESLERRASAMESGAAGQTLSAGVGGALVIAAKTVRADPLQHDAIRGGLAETWSEMERDGVDADALARLRASADRSLATAAIGGLIDDGRFEDARELLTAGRMPVLTEDDRREHERLVGRAERRAEAAGSAESEEIRGLAERLELDPEFLPPDSERLRDLLRDLDGLDSLTPEEQVRVGVDIRQFQNMPPQLWIPIREKFSELQRAARSRAAELEDARIDPDESRLIPIFQEYMKIEPANRASTQRLLFSRIPHSLIRPGGGSSDNVAWLERALLGNDQDQRDFAAAYLEYTGSAVHVEELEKSLDEPLQNVLSPPALEAYLRYWHVPFERDFPLQEDFGSLWSQRTAEVAEILVREWPVPKDIATGMVETLQRSLRASDEDAEAYLRHIDRVVAPLNRLLAERMRSTIETVRENRGSIDEMPGRYAFLLPDKDLIDLGEALGILTTDFTQVVDPPSDLLEHLGILTPVGSVVAGGSAVDVAVAGALATPVGKAVAAAGVVVAGLDIYNAIEDHNQEHNAFLVWREIQRRLHDTRTFEDILVDDDGQVGESREPEECQDDEECRFNEAFQALLDARRNRYDPDTDSRVDPVGLLPGDNSNDSRSQ